MVFGATEKAAAPLFQADLSRDLDLGTRWDWARSPRNGHRGFDGFEHRSINIYGNLRMFDSL